jgi:SAM-dependent methyltransferase
MDLSAQMLARAPADAGFRVRADAARLPLPDGSVDAAVLVNMMLFADEIARVLAPAGRLVWVNTSGEQTPIHLPSEEVHDALPGRWTGVASRAGRATWAVLWRA